MSAPKLEDLVSRNIGLLHSVSATASPHRHQVLDEFMQLAHLMAEYEKQHSIEAHRDSHVQVMQQIVDELTSCHEKAAKHTQDTRDQQNQAAKLAQLKKFM